MSKCLSLLSLLGSACLICGCADVVQLRTDLANTRAELAVLRGEHAKTVSDLAKVTRDFEGQKQSHVILGQAISVRDQQIQSLKNDVRDRDEVIAQLRDAESRLQADLKSLREQRDTLQGMVADYITQLQKQREDIAKLTAAVQAVPVAPPPLPAPNKP